MYLGLVLVGATPQTLAQRSKEQPDRNKINLLVPSQGYIYTFDLNPLIQLNKLAVPYSSKIKMSGRLVFLPQRSSDWEIIDTSGPKEIIEFIRKNFFHSALINPPNLPPFAEEMYTFIEVSKDAITTGFRTKFGGPNKAEEMSTIYSRMIGYAKSPNADTDVANNYYLINTSVRLENDQVFIVTCLPRAGLDALLATDAK